MFEMNKLGFLAFLLTGVGYVLKKFFEYSWTRKLKKKEYYQELILKLRGFHNGNPKQTSENLEEFLVLYHKGWMFFPTDVIRTINDFIDAFQPGTDNQNRKIAYQKLVLKIRKQFFSNSWFGKIFYFLEKENMVSNPLKYEELRCVDGTCKRK